GTVGRTTGSNGRQGWRAGDFSVASAAPTCVVNATGSSKWRGGRMVRSVRAAGGRAGLNCTSRQSAGEGKTRSRREFRRNRAAGRRLLVSFLPFSGWVWRTNWNEKNESKRIQQIQYELSAACG